MIEKDGFIVLSLTWDKEKILSPHEELNLRPSDSTLWCSTTEAQRLYGEQGYKIFPLSFHLWQDEKNFFLYFLTELKTKHLSYSIYKHDAIDTADPSIMQDACYIWTL